MQNVDAIARLIHKHRDQDHDAIRTALAGLRAPDVAEALNAVPSMGEVAEVLGLLPLDKAIEIVGEPGLGRRSAILHDVPPDLAARILDGVASDERTAIFRGMSAHCNRRLLDLLSPVSRREVERQLQYPDGSAGELMTTEFVRLDPTMSAAQALEHIREVARDRETIYACYVLEPGTDRLLGALSLRDLVMADAARPVVEIMRPNPVTVSVLEPRKEVARKISKYSNT